MPEEEWRVACMETFHCGKEQTSIDSRSCRGEYGDQINKTCCRCYDHGNGFGNAVMGSVLACRFVSPSQLINSFNASDTLIMFVVCNIIIITITLNAHLSELPRNSNEVTAFKLSSREEFGHASEQ